MDQSFKDKIQDLFVHPESQESLRPYYDANGRISGLVASSGRALPVVDDTIDFVGSDNYASKIIKKWECSFFLVAPDPFAVFYNSQGGL